ncbi:MAG: DUF4258 domain-containing protein [Nitrospinae bacterium]|nr:DUF4258 domain-containing protein [Nitrospinota bacterium]
MDSEGGVLLHPHALARATERGATIDEIGATIATGEKLEAKHGRLLFRKEFQSGETWRGVSRRGKILEVIAVNEAGAYIVITVIVKWF